MINSQKFRDILDFHNLDNVSIIMNDHDCHIFINYIMKACALDNVDISDNGSLKKVMINTCPDIPLGVALVLNTGHDDCHYLFDADEIHFQPIHDCDAFSCLIKRIFDE